MGRWRGEGAREGRGGEGRGGEGREGAREERGGEENEQLCYQLTILHILAAGE